MRLRVKLALGVSPMLVAMVLIGVVGGNSLTQLADSSGRILEDNYRTLLALQHMTQALERLDDAALGALRGQPAVPEATLAAARQRFEEELQVQEHNISEAGEEEATRRLRAAWTAWLAAAEQFRVQGSAAGFQRDYVDSLHPAFVAVRAAEDEILTLNQEAMVRKSERVKQGAQRSLSFVLVVSIAGFLIALFASATLTSRLLRPLSVLAQATRRLGSGDVAARARVEGKDEIAGLAADFNAMADRLQKYRQSSLGELLDAQRQSQATIDSLPDPVFVMTAEDQLLFANQAAETALKVSVETGMGPLDPALATVVEQVRRHVASGKGAWSPDGTDKAIRVTTPGGERNYLCRGTPVHGEDGAIIMTTLLLQDVTRFLRFEELRSDLATTVANQFRAPLTSLRMAIHLLSDEQLGPLGAQQADLVFAAREDCDRLQATVDELLDLSRIQAGLIELRTRPAEIEALVNHALAAQGPLAASREVQVRSEVLPGIGAVEADVDRVELVFANLLTNAIRNTADGGTVRVRAFAADDFVRFEVIDTGPGIAPEFQQAVFQRYFQLPGAPSGGTGIGLFIAREIVQAHRGAIGVESEPGKGATFWFKLPRVVPAEQARG